MYKIMHIFFIAAIAATALALTGVDACKNQPTQGGGGGNDTTSHNFTWTVDTLGTQTSYLTDVCIINDTDVWAVGEIHNDSTDYYDSTLKSYMPFFNTAHWNGKFWELGRVYWSPPPNGGIEPLRCCYAFAPNDIWLGGATPYHGDGRHWTVYNINGMVNGDMNKIWGTSDLNMFFGFQKGTILNDNESVFTPTQLNTTYDVQDIWGYADASGQITEALCLASSNGANPGTQLYQYTQSRPYWEPVNSKGLPYPMSGAWFAQNDKYYCAGSGVYAINAFSDNAWQPAAMDSAANNYMVAVRGNGANDIVIVGNNAEIDHWNGASWRRYSNLLNSYDELTSVSIKNNLIVAVGHRYYNGVARVGVIYIGKR